MSIPLTGTGGLFTRLGKWANLLRNVNRLIGTGYLKVNSLIGNGTTTTVTTYIEHGYVTGDTVTISGSTSANVNGSYSITVTGTKTFTYASAFNATANGNIYSVKTAGVAMYAVVEMFNAIEAQYQATDQTVFDGAYAQMTQYQGVHSSLQSYIQTAAQNTLIQMVADDTLQPVNTVNNGLIYLRSQMVANNQTIQQPTVTSSVAAGGSNNGNGVCISSVTNSQGIQSDYILTDSVVVTCTSDSQGSATLGSEPFSVVGQQAESNPLQWDWPLGSGVSGQVTATDNHLSAQSNVLQNSDFHTTTTPNLPDSWTVVTGSVGTQILSGGGGQAFDSVQCLEYVGDGSTLTSLKQAFGQATTSTGTTVKLLPLTVYAINGWVKCSATPAAGVLKFDLIDQNGTVLQNAQAVNQALSLNLTGVSTSYVAFNGYFQTPAVLPTTAYLRIWLSTALSAGKNVFIANVSMKQANQIYQGGPYVDVFSAPTKFVVGDNFTVTLTNTYNSQWALAVDQFFNMKTQLNPQGQPLQIPSGGSPTINDNLIT